MTGFIETITEYFKNAENFIYTYIITAVLLVVSVYFSLRTNKIISGLSEVFIREKQR